MGAGARHFRTVAYAYAVRGCRGLLEVTHGVTLGCTKTTQRAAAKPQTSTKQTFRLRGPNETNYGPAHHTIGTAIFQTRRGGGGLWDPKVCAPKMARSDFPDCILGFFPTTVTLVWGKGGPQGGGGRVTYLSVHGHSNTSRGGGVTYKDRARLPPEGPVTLCGSCRMCNPRAEVVTVLPPPPPPSGVTSSTGTGTQPRAQEIPFFIY